MSLTIDDQTAEAIRRNGGKVGVNAWKKPEPPKPAEKSPTDQSLAAIVSLLEKLPDVLKALANQQPPPEITVNVPAPRVTVAAPEINIPPQPAPQITFTPPSADKQSIAPMDFEVFNVKRDANNRLKGFRIRVYAGD